MVEQSFQSATQLHQAGKLDQAEELCRQILAEQPEHADCTHLLGVILAQQQQFAPAIDLMRRAIAIRPGIVQYYFNLGVALRRSGQPVAAAACFRQVLALEPGNATAFNRLGSVLHSMGQIDEGIAALIEAVRLGPDVAGFHFDAGTGYAKMGQSDQAIRYYREATRLDPKNAHYMYNFGAALAERGNFPEALDAFDKTIEMTPNSPRAHSNKGMVLNRLGQRSESLASLRHAVELDPDFPGSYNALGAFLEDEGKWNEAIDAYRKAIALDPESALYRWNYARALMVVGQWKEGWEDFESRLKLASLRLNRGFPQPQWDGSDPAGKTILAHAEGGHGDALNFVRFVPLVAQRGAKMILECHRGLAPLFEGMDGVDRVIARGQPLPAFDWQIPLQSLPRIFGITPQNIPNQVPYVSAPADRAQRWADRLAAETKLRVGLVWSGTKYSDTDYRTRTIDVFAPLAEVPGVKFFSLQKGKDSAQAPPPGMDWADFTSELNDFADTAALVQNLDLVISVDTSPAHLAGAMGKPVWVLIMFKSEFRWLLDRTDTPWYPTMRLFRQPTETDWQTPIREMAAALRGFKR